MIIIESCFLKPDSNKLSLKAARDSIQVPGESLGISSSEDVELMVGVMFQ